MKKFSQQCSFAVFALGFAAVAVAQSTPKVIRMVVPFSAGGPTDTTVRILGESMKSFGNIIVENKPGAGGSIAADQVKRSTPDGSTFGVMAVDELAINPWLTKRPADHEKDFVPVGLIASVPNVLVISNSASERLKINTLADLIAYAKKNPDKLTFASGGNGSVGHLLSTMLKSRAEFEAVHVPYKGGQPAQLALMAGEVDFAFNTLPTWASQIKAGKVKPLAVTSARRVPELPETPALAETWKGFEAETWWGVMAPAGTPKAVIDSTNKALVASLQDPGVKKKFGDLLIHPAPTTPQEFSDLIKREVVRYEKVVKDSGAVVN